MVEEQVVVSQMLCAMRHALALIVFVALVVAVVQTPRTAELWPLWLAIVAVAIVTARWYRK